MLAISSSEELLWFNIDHHGYRQMRVRCVRIVEGAKEKCVVHHANLLIDHCTTSIPWLILAEKLISLPPAKLTCSCHTSR